MPYVILGRERFALPIGETRIGGTGDDALPFPELASLATAAVLLVTTEEAVSLWPQIGSAAPVTINGTRLGTEPTTLTHGAKIDVAGVRLLFGDLRQIGTTEHVTPVVDDEIALLGGNGPSEATADSGGRFVALATGAVTTIPDGGLVVGRDPDSDFVIAGMEVSRRHAVVRASIQGYVISDISTNGTYVNGRRIDGSCVLGMRDVVRIGREELRFEAAPATYEPAAELRGAEPPPTPAFRPSTEPPTMPLRDAARLLATLEIINEGVLKGTRFRIERPVVHVGRAPHNDVPLADSTVSGSHATLTRRGSGWVVLDHDSTNGTYIDGERISGERPLSQVTELRFGNIKMVFRSLASGADADATSTRAVVGVSLKQSRKRRS